MTSRTFTAKELEVLYGTIEHIAHHFYKLGQADSKEGKSLKAEEFSLSRGRKLEIKTAFQKAINSR